MKILKELKYTKTHEWVNFLDDTTALIGLDDFAQNALGDLVFMNAPAEGDSVEAGEIFGDVESVKAVSDMYCGVSGVVAEVNEEVVDSPEKINADPYGSWIIKVEQITDKGDLMDADEYENYCKEEH